MKPSDFIHPEDAAALRQMEGIPGFAALVKKILAIGIENLQYGVNMASSVRLSEKQLPEIYQHLPPICQRLGIPEPELYLLMDPVPNAWTSGDTRIYITVTSGLVEMMSDEELDAVIAHECGHILCRHVLYHTVAQWINSGLANLGLLGTLATPMQYALCYWSRKSELSADLFILCWSENASKSEYVEKERMQALKRAFPQVKPQQAAKLSIYPMSIETRTELPTDMKDNYHFGEM